MRKSKIGEIINYNAVNSGQTITGWTNNSVDTVLWDTGVYTDARISLLIGNLGSGYGGIAFHKTSGTDYLYAAIVYGTTSSVKLRKRVNDVDTTISSVDLTASGVLVHELIPIALEVVVSGDRIKVYVNNVLLINNKSTDILSFPKGECGIISDSGNSHDFKYFNIQELKYNKFNPSINKILCLGSSITLGYGAAFTYPNKLKEKLDANFLKTACTITNAGVASSTSADYIVRLPTLMTTNTPQIVIIEVSVNDFHTNAFVPLDTCEANLRTLIKYVKGEDAIPIICTITPVDPTKDDEYWTPDTWHNIYQMNMKIRQLIKDENVMMIDTANAFSCNMSLFGDGVHPNDTGVQLYCDTVYNALTKQYDV